MRHIIYCLLFLISTTSLCQDTWFNAFKNKNQASFLGSWLPLSDEQKLRLGSIVGVLSSDPVDFSKEEYERYMEFVKKIDPEVYAQMKEGEAKTGVPAVQKIKYIEGEGVSSGPEEAPGYPIIWIQSLSAKNNDQDAFISALTKLIADYKVAYVPPITKDEQQQVMEILKDIAPDLYTLIVKVDPTGENHVKRNDEYPGQGASVI